VTRHDGSHDEGRDDVFVIEQIPWRPWSFDKRGSQPADVDRYQR
jgi:hypothetical protein